jgi:hypothetical protein
MEELTTRPLFLQEIVGLFRQCTVTWVGLSWELLKSCGRQGHAQNRAHQKVAATAPKIGGLELSKGPSGEKRKQPWLVAQPKARL